MTRNDQQGCSFVDVLHEAPTLLEELPPEAVKALSATCRSLRTLFCAQVKVASLMHAEEASKLCCTTWPHLLMVVFTCGPQLASKLSARWEVLMGLTLSSSSWGCKTAVLVRSGQKMQPPLLDLPKQHSAVLLDVACRYRRDAAFMDLRGPLVSCRVVQLLSHRVWPTMTRVRLSGAPQLDAESMSHLNGCLPSLVSIDITDSSAAALELLRCGTAWPQVVSIDIAHNQLDASAISVLPQAQWTHLRLLKLNHNMLGASGMQHLVASSWPLLAHLYLANTGIDGPALRYFAGGQWPQLQGLDLTENNIDAIGMSCLLQGSWPLLTGLVLSEQALDAEACSLLGIAYPAKPTIKKVPRKSGLVQLPFLNIETRDR